MLLRGIHCARCILLAVIYWLTRLCFKGIRVLDYLKEMYGILPQVLRDIVFIIVFWALGLISEFIKKKKKHEMCMAVFMKWHFDNMTLKKKNQF